jgi:hypothetical protein
MPILSLIASLLEIGRGLAGSMSLGWIGAALPHRPSLHCAIFFRQLIRGNGLFASRLQDVKAHFAGQPEIDLLFDFIDNAGRNGVCQSFKR